MVSSRVRSIHFGDIHLGHDLNPTNKILENLDREILDIKLLVKLDFIFINGDVFHRLLSSNSSEYTSSIQWLTKLLYIGAKHNIRIRLLHGTISHDRDQCSILDNIIKESSIDVDYRYITDITIEHVDEYNMDILYVPDNYGNSALDAKLRVEYLMSEYGLTKVDMCMMHGNFPYQLRGYVSKYSHDIEFYTSIVNYSIVINHIHSMSVNGKVLGPGSIDRLAHGEEEDKGMIYTEIRPDGTMDYIFIVNKNSMPFITYDVLEDDIIKITSDIKKIFGKHMRYINIRLRYGVDYKGYTGHIRELGNTFKDIRFTDIKMKDKDIERKEKLITGSIPDVLEITEANIKDLLISELKDTKMEPSLRAEVNKIIGEI